MVMAEVDKRNCWAVPFVLNNIYDAWWNYGIDWTSIAVVPSVYFNESDVGTQNTESCLKSHKEYQAHCSFPILLHRQPCSIQLLAMQVTISMIQPTDIYTFVSVAKTNQ
jgi:hypothetical protein